MKMRFEFYDKLLKSFVAKLYIYIYIYTLDLHLQALIHDTPLPAILNLIREVRGKEIKPRVTDARIAKLKMYLNSCLGTHKFFNFLPITTKPD